jgi:hypothetical protein
MPMHIHHNVQAPLLQNATLSSEYDVSREKFIGLEAVLCDILNRDV